jgi:signal transduction histidine kinase
MRLAVKIFLAQSLVILVVAGVAFWSITEVSKLLTADRAITTRTAEALRLEVSLRESVRRTTALERRYIVFGDQEYASIPREEAQQIEKDLERLGGLLTTELERARLREATQSFSAFREVAAKGRQLRSRGDVKRAGEVIDAEALPAAERAIGELGRLIDLTQANLDFAATKAQTALTEAQEAAQRLQTRTWNAVVIALLVAVSAALTGSAAIAYRMTQSLRRLSAGTTSLAEGAFHEIPVTSSDEIGQLARSFNAMAARLRELDQMKEQFYATVSHELRSPLSSAREAAQLLREGAHGPLTAKQERLVRIIHGSTDRLLHLVNDILDLSRVGAGLLPLDLKPLELDQAAGRAIDELRIQAEERKVALARQRGPGDFSMVGDENRLVQVLVNLIANAIRFTPEGGQVIVRLVDAGAELEAHVEDTGAGIPADQLPVIFERYRQAHTGRGGTGLGLSIVQAMVAAHGGRVTVESQEGKGSRFSIILPRKPPAAAESAKA